MKHLLVVCLFVVAGSVMVTGLTGNASAQSQLDRYRSQAGQSAQDQMNRMQQESQRRQSEMQNYMNRMQSQRPSTGFDDIAEMDEPRAFKKLEGPRNYSMPGDPDYDTSSSSSSSGSYRVRGRGMGKLIGLVVMGVLAVGGWMIRMVTGGGD